MSKFLYCVECNDVFELGSHTNKCDNKSHTHAVITGNKYIKWVLSDKKKIELRKKKTKRKIGNGKSRKKSNNS